MDDQLNLLDYGTIKGAVAREKWATERILKHYDSYMDELATVKETQPDGSMRAYVDEDLKQEIALKLLEEIPDFPLEKPGRGANRKLMVCESIHPGFFHNPQSSKLSGLTMNI